MNILLDHISIIVNKDHFNMVQHVCLLLQTYQTSNNFSLGTCLQTKFSKLKLVKLSKTKPERKPFSMHQPLYNHKSSKLFFFLNRVMRPNFGTILY